jgi:hypothetical protein
MRAIFVVVGNVFTEQAFQVPFIERDDVIQQFSAAAAHPTLGDAIGMSIQLRRMAMLRLDVSE